MTSHQEKAESFRQLVLDVQACRLCPRMQQSRRILSSASGQLNSRVMFVGEAPGRLGADASEIPFHGDKSGDNFERLLDQAGITRYDCFVTNAVLCNPRDEKGNNATPNRLELSNCHNFLRRQIDVLDPVVVVSLGAQALSALRLLEPHTIELSSGVRRAFSWYGRTLIPAYHPGQRAMIHRSFLNQISDYRFIYEQITQPLRGPARRRSLSPPPELVAAIVKAILRKAHTVGYFQLHKLFYLVEYEHMKRHGRRLSRAYIIRQKNGPYVTDLHLKKLQRAISSLQITNINDSLVIKAPLSQDLFEERAEEIIETHLSMIDEIVCKYGKYTDEELKRVVYLTQPMRRILRSEKYEGQNFFNAPIDLAYIKY